MKLKFSFRILLIQVLVGNSQARGLGEPLNNFVLVTLGGDDHPFKTNN